MQKRILVITHDLTLLATQSSMLLKAGYAVSSADKAESALKLLEKNSFDLVLIGRNSAGLPKQIAQELRGKYPNIIILKIVDIDDQGYSYASHVTDSRPDNVIAAINGILNQGT